MFLAGTPRLMAKPDGMKLTRSGFTVTVSDAAWTLRDQAQDACSFLAVHEAELATLSSLPEVEDVRLDFPIEKRDVLTQSEYFPSELVRAAGRAGIGLEITIYLCAGDET
ncbi:hypothetical protein BE15_23865 [Sorangium cellulosum]|uniref:Uncharacterized protein n=2 Tax=Sorangium cellulosum TaxID=56 RepID=A0A150QPU7_SORCE|nr:hypothetical protein BE15_23865 [Sorangium cellulosum]